MIENLETAAENAVASKVHELKDKGCRFVTMTACTNSDGTVDVFYSFDKDYKLYTLKTTVQAGTSLRSISDIYLAAAFAENEISELFEVSFANLAVDYGGHFILADGAPESPFGAGVIIERKGGSNAEQ
ncbi:MAG TPA: NADH-quinone oxidoreductase subunit C [Ruminiclostridium sp.]|nr:NADH-quinone oxidoreductase subunit C [Ruminiclostridium sp.]